MSLRFATFFDDIFNSLLTQLKLRAKLQHTEQVDSAIWLLLEQALPSTAILIDDALTEDKHANIGRPLCIRYTCQEGTSVIMGQFPALA